jgi:outer membrane protein assembly factor BamB
MPIVSSVKTYRELNTSLTKKWEFEAKTAIYSDIACGDINGDGKKEVVFKTNEEEVVVLSDKGEKLWGFSLNDGTDLERLFLDRDSIRVVCSSPVLADIDDDGREEIIVGGSNGKLYVISSNGKKLWDFSTNNSINSTPTVGDINNDGKPEIIFGSNDHSLYVLDCHGNKLWTFEANLEIQSGIAVADINGDGRPEVIFGSDDNHLYALTAEGALLWEFQTGGSITARPAVGDLHRDGQQKIVFGSHDCFVYVVKSNGLPEWKYKVKGKVVSEVSLSDINFDKKLEIIVTMCSCEDNVLILSNTRDVIGNFGAGFWVTSSSIVRDIDHDGNYEIIFGSYDHHLYILTFRRDLKEYYLGELKQEVTLFDTESLIVGTPAVIEDAETLIVLGNEKGRVIALKL